jgi:hypothetical protein
MKVNNTIVKGSGAHPASYPMGTGGSSPPRGGGSKATGGMVLATHLPPPSAKAKNDGAILPLPTRLNGMVYN